MSPVMPPTCACTVRGALRPANTRNMGPDNFFIITKIGISAARMGVLPGKCYNFVPFNTWDGTMETKRMRIKFEGDAHQIDANTLVNCLIHYSAVVSAANDVLGQGGKKVSVKVNAIEKGSFVLDLSLLEETVRSLFSQETVGYLAALVTSVSGVWAAYKFFSGRKATDEKRKREFDTTFNASTGNTNVSLNNSVVNIYNRPDVREAISSTIRTADADQSVQGIRIESEGVAEVSIPRADFKKLEHGNSGDGEESLPTLREEEVDAVLTIVSLNFERGNKWQFMYEGFRISMTVKDDALQKRIDGGDRFGKGDSVRVRMRITKEYNRDYRAYVNKRYKIVEFYEHIVPPQQPTLFG